MPDGMTLVFTSDSDNVNRYDLVPDPDYEVTTELLPGDYSIITWSNDDPSIDVTPDDDGKDIILTHTDPSVMVPSIYYAFQDEIIGLLDEETTQQVVITPERANSIYNVRVLGTDVLPGVITWKSSLSGLIDAIYLKSGKPAPNAKSQTFTFYLDQVDGTVRSHKISTLGKYPTSQNDLILYLTDANGETVYYKFDVTKQITSAPDPKNVTIEVNLRDAVPVSPGEIFDGGDGSMVPDVDNYENVDDVINL